MPSVLVGSVGFLTWLNLYAAGGLKPLFDDTSEEHRQTKRWNAVQGGWQEEYKTWFILHCASLDYILF